MLLHGIPLVIVAGMLNHLISILLNTYAHFITIMQDQSEQPTRKNVDRLGFATQYTAQLMDDIITPNQDDLIANF